MNGVKIIIQKRDFNMHIKMGYKKFYDELLNNAFTIPVKVNYWDNTNKIYGTNNKNEEPNIEITFNDPIEIKEILNNASLAFGEAIMDGRVEIKGSVEDLITSIYEKANSFLNNKKFKKFMPKQSHTEKHSQEDIQSHYDLGNDFYKLWLDPTLTYSCAYFKNKDDSLEQAQHNKIEYILRKLNPKPGEKLLDIGCGWGTLILTAAKKFNLKVTGITLSKEQFNLVKQKIEQNNLEDVAEVRLLDYRELGNEKWKYITSVGMFEHVGKDNLNKYFEAISQHLDDNGVALIHGITRQQGGATNAWLNKYIFPGGYIPGLEEITHSIVDNNLQIKDIDFLRKHYQKTLEIWFNNFNEHREQIEEMFDDKFARMWSLYLQACAASFKSGNIDVIEYLLINDPIKDSLPMTRSYMYK